MPPWKPPWKSMEDPGEVSSYYPQTFPGHPRDLALEYMEAGPPGVGLVAGAGMHLANLIGSAFMPIISGAIKNKDYELLTLKNPNYAPNEFVVDWASVKDPKYSRTALRDIYNQAKSGGHDKVVFYGSDIVRQEGQKYPLKDLAMRAGARPWSKNPSPETNLMMEIDLKDIAKLLGIKNK